MKLLLIDEDPLFRSRMQRAAAAQGIALTSYARLRDVEAAKASKNFDVLVLNYFSDEVRENTGDSALQSLPALLVSNTNVVVADKPLWRAEKWQFARKGDGCDAILDAAQKLHGGLAATAGALLGRLKTALKR